MKKETTVNETVKIRRPLTDEQKARKRAADKARLLRMKAEQITSANGKPKAVPDADRDQPAEAGAAIKPTVEPATTPSEEGPVSSTSVATVGQTTADFTEMGWRVALAELASAKGQTVEDVAKNADALRTAGLPADVPPGTIRRAHRLHRDAVDGMLYRCNVRPATVDAPELSKAEADAVIASSAPAIPAKSSGAATAPRPSSRPPAAAAKPASKVGILGFSACRVVMWMGARGMSFEQAKRVVTHFGATIGDGTIRGNLKSADTGKLGKPADPTEAQAAQIVKIAGTA
jgi:hypothetical protein